MMPLTHQARQFVLMAVKPYEAEFNIINKIVVKTTTYKSRLIKNNKTMKSRILSSSTLTGQKIHNLNDEHIGDIKDLMIDLNNAEIAYVVISFGGFMGIGNKLFAMPLEAFKFSDNEDTIRLDIDKDKLENAPSFDKDNWPLTADDEFIDSVYSHYGYQSKRSEVVK